MAEDIAELAIGHVRADLIARYNKDEAWSGRRDAFTKVSAHVAALTSRQSPTHGASHREAPLFVRYQEKR